MKIVYVTRSKIRIESQGRRATFTGEAVMPGGDVDFYVNRDSISEWDDGTPIAGRSRDQLIADLLRVAAQAGLLLVVD